MSTITEATITIGNIRYERTHGDPRLLPRQLVYVARPTALGNPYVIGKDGPRAAVVAAYAAWLDEQLADPQSPAAGMYARLRRVLADTGRLHLLCWCAPERCHAEVIRERLLAEVQR